MKIEEYAPEATPIIRASENHLRVSPPKKNKKAITIITVSTVLIDLPKVWFKLWFTVSSKLPVPFFAIFSLILSKTTIVSWTENPKIVRRAATVGMVISAL